MHFDRPASGRSIYRFLYVQSETFSFIQGHLAAASVKQTGIGQAPDKHLTGI